MGEDDSRFSSSDHVGDSEELEVQSPLKKQAGSKHTGASTDERSSEGTSVGKKLFQQKAGELNPGQRKRKSEVLDPVSLTPDLNIPLMGSSAIVPVGIVNSRINKLDGGTDGGADSSDGSMIETLKSRKRGNTKQNARSAGAVNSSSHRAQ